MAFQLTHMNVMSCVVALFLAGSLIALSAAKKRGRDCDLLDEHYDADCFEIIDFEDALEAGFISVELDIIYRIPDGYFGLKWNVDQTTLVLNVSKPFVQSLSPNIVNHLDILGSFILFNGNSMTITIGEIGDGTAFQIKSFDALGNWENEEENELICIGYLNYETIFNVSLILNYEEAIKINIPQVYTIEQFVCNTSIDVLGQVVLDNFEIKIGNITDIAEESSSSSSSSKSSSSSSSSYGSSSSSGSGHDKSSSSGSKRDSSSNYGSNSGSNSGDGSSKSSSKSSSGSNSGGNSGSESASESG